VAVFAGRVSLALDLVAAVAAVAGGRRLARCLRALLAGLDEEGLLRWDETFLDGSFAPAKKGASRSVKPSAARERSGWTNVAVKVSLRGVIGAQGGLRLSPTFAGVELAVERICDLKVYRVNTLNVSIR
jgi:hypothetical protein